MTTRRIALMGMHLESNDFAPASDEAAFRTLCYMEGEEILDDLKHANPSLPAEIGAFVATMNGLGEDWRPAPILVTAAEPGGPVDHGFFERTKAEMERRLLDAMPLDGVYFSAHGAMTSTEVHDPDGELFEMVRRVIGPDAPLLATLDLHANISERMVEQTDVLISYLTNPHIDQEARAGEAAGLMVEMFNGMKPEPVFIRLPLVAPSITLLSAEGPYADLINYGQATKTNEIANVSVIAGFVYGNTPKNGIAVIVTGRNDAAPARALANEIARRGWDTRDRFRKDLTSIEDAVKAACVSDGKPVILADVADNPGGGGSGNTIWLLSALLAADAEDVYFGIFNDPALARAAGAAGIGTSFTAVFNSETESEFSKRLEAEVRVLALHDGKCVGRRGIWAGRSLTLGPTALLQVSGIKIVVVSNRKQCADPVFFEMFGLEITEARALVVKSRGHFRAGFDEFFPPERILEVDAPGLVSPVLTSFEFAGLKRPIYPFDADMVWQGPTGA